MPLGLSGLSSVLAASLGRFRGLFIGLSIVMLAFSHYSVYKKQNASKVSKIILWGSTVISVGILIYTLING